MGTGAARQVRLNTHQIWQIRAANIKRLGTASVIGGWDAVEAQVGYQPEERIKSAVVDSVRSEILAQGSRTAEQEEALVASLTQKLNRAGRIWGWERPLTAALVRSVLDGPENPAG